MKDLTFSNALVLVKLGHKIARNGWNGKGMFVYYVNANSYPTSGNANSSVEGMFEDNMVPYQAYLAFKTADNNIVPWLASQTDLLANDWSVV